MDSLSYQIATKFVNVPTSTNLQLVHDFLAAFPKKNKQHVPIFLNAYFHVFRDMNNLSLQCMKEIVYLFENFDCDDKLYFITMEELTNFMQNYCKSKSDNEENFEALGLDYTENILNIYKFIFGKINNTNSEKLLFGNFSSLPMIGYLTAFLLCYLESHSEKQIQLKVLDILKDLTDYQTPNAIMKSDFIVNIAPGIIQSLFTIIKTDRKIGSEIKSKSILNLENLIILLFDEKNMHNQDPSMKGFEYLKEYITIRNEEWRLKAWENVKRIIMYSKYNILERDDKEHYKVKLAWLNLCKHILYTCPCDEESAMNLIDSIIQLSCDPDDNIVQESAKKEINTRLLKLKIKKSIQTDVNDSSSTVEFEETGELLIIKTVRANLDTVLGQLTNLDSRLSDGNKLTILATIRAYLEIYLIHNLGSISHQQLEKMINNLIGLLHLNHQSVNILRTTTVIDRINQCTQPTMDGLKEFAKSFCYFHDSRIYTDAISSIFDVLVQLVNPQSILSLLQAEDDPLNLDKKIASTLITIVFIRSAIRTRAIEISLYRSLLSRYFSPEVLQLRWSNEIKDDHNSPINDWLSSFWQINRNKSITMPSDKGKTNSKSNVGLVAEFRGKNNSDKLSPSVLKKHTLILSLVMELCTECSMVLKQFEQDSLNQKLEDSWLMRHTLYSVMSMTCDSPEILSQSALRCLVGLANSLPKYNSSISELISQNSDYIMERVSRQLRSGAISMTMGTSSPVSNSQSNNIESALRCMITMSHYATKDILPHLQSMLDQLFFYMDRASSYKQRVLFLPILAHVADMILKWCSDNHSTQCDDTSLTVKHKSSWKSNVVNSNKTLEDVIMSIQSFLKQRSHNKDDDTKVLHKYDGDDHTKVPDNDDDDDNDGGGGGDDFNDKDDEIEDDKKIYGLHVDILKKIIDRCINMLSSSCPRTRKRCIETIQCCLMALNTENDQDLIRPLIHQIWIQLETRFKDKYFPVLLAAVELVDLMANISGDFLYCKVRGSFVVKLSEVLEQAALISLSVTATLKYTGLYKMQKKLMCFMANLIIKTDYRGYSDVESVIDSLVFYLTEEQPEELVDESKRALRLIASNYDPYIVWYKVSRIISEIKSSPQFSLVGNLPIRNPFDDIFSNHYSKPCQDLIGKIELDNVLRVNN